MKTLKEYRTGKKHSAETIKKMKLSIKKRLSSGMKGKIHTYFWVFQKKINRAKTEELLELTFNI
jgi:hypothetical protein